MSDARLSVSGGIVEPAWFRFQSAVQSLIAPANRLTPLSKRAYNLCVPCSMAVLWRLCVGLPRRLPVVRSGSSCGRHPEFAGQRGVEQILMPRFQRFSGRPSHLSPFAWFPSLLAACIACGCSSLPDNPVADDPPGGGGAGEVSARIISILANASISVNDPAIVIFYEVAETPNSINAVFVKVAENSSDAAEIGDRQSLATNLPASGDNAFFQFFPSGPGAGVGFYRVGIEVTTNGQTIEAFSDGVIHVQGRPAPCFTRPCNVSVAGAAAGVTFDACGGLVCDLVNVVAAGDADGVDILFDAGDPEGAVEWRLFYLDATESCANPSEQLGTQILTGSGNVPPSVINFLTAELPVGDFQIGLSATDSGMSVAETAEFDGDDDRIVTVCGPVVRIVP